MSSSVPRHVAVIMDGNGRWAQQRGLPRVEGHAAGAESVRQITRACARQGVEVLTLYSFSTENWKRPEEEVEALMALLAQYLRDELTELTTNRIRLRAIGQLDRLPKTVRMLLGQVCEATSHQPGMQLVLALSYGSRAEIVDAVRKIAREVADGSLSADQIDDATIDAHLYTAGLPDPDLLIRTSGELRLSNFLLWQVAYSELYVTDVLWPDFREEHLAEAFRAYGGRQRRFGKTGAQIVAESEEPGA
jgi:undecaprenyl diphosphate synthase